MKLQSINSFLLVFAGISVIGLLYLGLTPPSISYRFKEQKPCINITQKNHENALLQSPQGITQKNHENALLQSPQGLSYNQPSVFSSDGKVIPLSPWLAPVVSEGTFDPTLIDAIYKQQNITIATTVFALGKYTMFLKGFLESAEQYFFVGFRVRYYVFTDHPEQVPEVKLGEKRQLMVMTVNSSSRWQEMSLGRMKRLEKLIESGLVSEADYLFSLDVDTKFYGRWGAETLGHLIGVIHAWFYYTPREKFPYERRPESQAFIPYSEGDYYYGGAVLGGSVKYVYQLVKTCREQLDIDAAKSIEAAWQEESHLNKYFLYNKPSKLLSPEYSWDDNKAKIDQIKIIRYSHVVKNYAKVRPNP